MSNLEYNGQVLSNARRDLKIKEDDIATELCLSVKQVNSLENNLEAFFNSNILKQTVIKRYCRFLDIDVNSVITRYEIDTTDNNFQEVKKDNFGKKNFKKYLYISIAAFMVTVACKLIA